MAHKVKLIAVVLQQLDNLNKFLKITEIKKLKELLGIKKDTIQKVQRAKLKKTKALNHKFLWIAQKMQVKMIFREIQVLLQLFYPKRKTKFSQVSQIKLGFNQK